MKQILADLKSRLSDIKSQHAQDQATLFSGIEYSIAEYLQLADYKSKVCIISRQEGWREENLFYSVDFKFYLEGSNYETIQCGFTFNQKLEISCSSIRENTDKINKLMLISKVIDWFVSGISGFVTDVQTVMQQLEVKYNTKELRDQIYQVEEVIANMEIKAKADRVTNLLLSNEKIDLLPKYDYSYDENSKPYVTEEPVNFKFQYRANDHYYAVAFQLMSTNKTKKLYSVRVWSASGKEMEFYNVKAIYVSSLIERSIKWNETGSAKSRAEAEDKVARYTKE